MFYSVQVGNSMVSGEQQDRSWCILRTSGGRTLALAKSLAQAGFEVWTPLRTVKREAPGNRRRLHMGQRKVYLEATLPILSGFVFIRREQLTAAIAAGALPLSPHPSFHVLQIGDCEAVAKDSQMLGLRAAEAEAHAAITALREAEGREADRRARAERLSTERARRKALRKERRVLARGAHVSITQAPAFDGMEAVVIEGLGASAIICFGGTLTLEVEAWRIRPVEVSHGHTRHRDAA